MRRADFGKQGRGAAFAQTLPVRLEAFQPYTPPLAMFAVYRKDTPLGPAGR